MVLFLYWLSVMSKLPFQELSFVCDQFQFLRCLSNIKWMHQCCLGLEKIICSQSIVSSSRTDLCTDVSAGRVSWTGRLLSGVSRKKHFSRSRQFLKSVQWPTFRGTWWTKIWPSGSSKMLNKLVSQQRLKPLESSGVYKNGQAPIMGGRSGSYSAHAAS